MDSKSVFRRVLVSSIIAFIIGFLNPFNGVRAADGVAINKTNFPDDTFRSYVSRFDENKNRYLSENEIECVDRIDVSNSNVSSLKGIEYFTYLSILNCYGNNLTELDLTNNSELKDLWCGGNQLTTIKFSTNNMLERVSCVENQLTSLDLGQSSRIKELYCENNSLLNLNVTGCSKLTRLYCDGNQLESLDVTYNASLAYLFCSNNRLSSLDVSKNIKLVSLGCSNNQIDRLDVKYNPDLVSFSCGNNQIENLSIKSNRQLSYLECNDNLLRSLDVSGNPKLEFLYCPNNQIDKLNLKNNTNLCHLYCDHNRLAALDIKHNLQLQTLNCSYNFIDNLDVSNNALLDCIHCEHNNLSFLDVYSNKELSNLVCYSNKIKSMYIYNCTNLVLSYKEGIKDNPVVSGKRTVRYQYEYEFDPDQDFYYTLHTDENIAIYTTEPTPTPTPTITPVKPTTTPYPVIVKINKTSVTLLQGGIEALVASVKGTTDKIVWKSSNPDIATVDSSGKVSAKMAGIATISATVSGKTATCTVTVVKNDVTTRPIISPTSQSSISISLDCIEDYIVCGKSDTLHASIKGASSKITWKSSDPKIASVDTNGVVVAKAAGCATITASAAGENAACTVFVLYKDVVDSTDFWYIPTYYLTNDGVVKGYDKQTLFKPANECTRAQMVTFLWRLAGCVKPKTSYCRFPDVCKDDYFYYPVIWAVENGITTGYKDGLFKPQNVCTRAQTVTFLWRLAGEPAVSSNSKYFTDIEETDYFYRAVNWASSKKIVVGYDDDTFRPQGRCLRRQMVTFLYKFDAFADIASSVAHSDYSKRSLTPTITPRPTTRPTVKPTPKPTTKPVVPTAVPTPRPTATPTPEPHYFDGTYYYTSSGHCYHSIPNCGNTKKAYSISLQDAIAMGLSPCSKCC